MNEKDLVDQIHIEKAKNDSNSRDLARLINTLSKTVFGNVNRFVFELLQNADDASTGNDQEIDVSFQLLDNYLIFSHNGAHFTGSDVQGISGIGNRASEKDKAVEKTGYKGIGFKSVFGSSDYAHIISGGFSFRFDKSFEGYKGSEEFPWQVIPIWTTEPVTEVASHYDTSRVNTIIAVKNRESIRSEIEKVLRDCQILLFLRRVNSITFCDKENTVIQIFKDISVDGVIDLYSSSELLSSWIIKTYELEISETLSDKLNLLSEAECPKKLKEAATTKITFAANVKDNLFLPLKNAVLYAYLPTKAALGFPFLVNGDFLTNAERTELMPNVWNEFLLSEIAAKQIDWFLELQDSAFCYEVLRLLKGKFPLSGISDIEKAYNTNLEKAANSVDFIPEQKSELFVSISKGIIDLTGFTEYFEPSLVKDFFKLDNYHGVIDLRVKSQTNLSALGTRQFTFTQVLELVATGVFKDTVNATNLIVFFYNRTLNGNNQNWLPILADATFILDNDGHFKTPKETFFPLNGQQQGNETDFENLSFVHRDILAHFAHSAAVIKWLQNLGVKEPTDLEIVRKALIPLIKDHKINNDNAVRITRFIFKVSISKMLSEADYEELKELKVLTVNGLKKPGQSYLSDLYNPEKKLSAIIPNANFIWDGYPENPDQIAEWKAFFKKIGVRENITIEITEEKIERTAFERLHPEATAYFSWLEENVYYPAIYHSWSRSGQHYIQNFTGIDFREHFAVFEFSKFFWGRMLTNWDEFLLKCSKTQYYYRNGSDKVPSFVQYYIRKFDAIPCTDGRCYKSVNVFSPALKSIVGSYFPVADLSASITSEQADFFGFKRSISIPGCLELLEYLSTQPITADNRKQIFAIYDQLISQSSERSSTLKSRIATWRRTARLLTINNTFQPIGQLYCFSVMGADAPVTSERFIKTPSKRSFDEIAALCDLLNIEVITSEKLKFVSEGVEDELELPKAILDRSRFLALIYAHDNNENFSEVLSRLRYIISNTRFFKAGKLSLIYQQDNDEVIFDSSIDSWNDKISKFFFTGKWNSAVTLYTLSSTICSLLGFKDMEREFQLALQSSEQEIFDWMQQKGYEVADLAAHGLQEEIFASHVDDDIEMQVQDPFEGVDIEFEETFIPKVKVADIDFQNLQPEIKIHTTPIIPSAQEYAQISAKKVMTDVGKWSENFIYEYFKENSMTFTEINWLNKDAESYLPYDFEVTENGIKRLVEVKGTSSFSKEIVYMSPAEWKTLFDQGLNYTLFRVFGAGSDAYRFERTDNLRGSIESGLIMPSPIQLVI